MEILLRGYKPKIGTNFANLNLINTRFQRTIVQVQVKKSAKGKVQKYVHISFLIELGSVAGPVIQANGRLTFEDDLRS